MNTDSRATELMSSISHELFELRDSIARNDLSAIEAHTHSTREMLAELRPLLIRDAVTSTPEFVELKQSVHACMAMVHRAGRTVRSLLNVYRSFSDPSNDLMRVQS